MKLINLSGKSKVLSTVVAAGVLAVGGVATASPAHDLTAVTTAEGKFVKPHNLRVNNVTDVVEQTLTIQPGGDTGWHVHPGLVVLTVQKGTIVRKSADCNVEVFPAGTSFIKQGDLPLNGVNEGTEPVELHLTYLKPTGTPLRYEREAPKHCNFD
ncbi:MULTISPECIES: cupin domain-containing protein [Streptomyces]|uniref:Cupin domain-containing protein n=1 Tax=Streptomyces sudanensis TaxID=436397 RepID=A0ABY4TEG2_9ACTN|nr:MULTISPECIES: cupin domain-containing protein [Streptomyces]MCP9958930.1 cupin domain-containing protein [Streptomyces sudanensis]MCP9987999.1 cupin domain-containing protein [Streptomyces sudanensis]MCQ0000593.1 cupin domain-containing protein [Streptomyces sudanensis]URN16178.1 cupin domain-containing protein [Streptomyces sudanensis]